MVSQNRIKKEETVRQVADVLTVSSSYVLVDYTGLSVKAQQELKTRLKAIGSTMVVVKNTLLKLAGSSIKAPSEVYSDSVLVGQTALIYTSGDPIAPIQVLAKFAKEFELTNMKVGVVDGSFQSHEALTKLASLPSKEVLSAQVVGAIAASMYGLVGVLQGNLQKLVYMLDQKAKQG